jgi:hypothetical protein
MWVFLYWLGYGAVGGSLATLAVLAFVNLHRVGRRERRD